MRGIKCLMTQAPESHSLASRKSDHLIFAQAAQAGPDTPDWGLDYEPLFGVHPTHKSFDAFTFLGKSMRLPLWVSSMTGGTSSAHELNQLLATTCARYGLGMGLGSCRSLLESDEFFADFDMRGSLGPDAPFFANIGIAQLEELVTQGQSVVLDQLVSSLKADGLIVHLNPLQEWFQPEGDRLKVPAIEILRAFCPTRSYPIIVKEVGQGLGARSLLALSELKVAGLEFGALGGTNFSKLEKLRRDDIPEQWEDFTVVGHRADEMLTNLLHISKRIEIPALIISGGIRSCVQGHSLLARAPEGSVLGLGLPFLEQARKGEQALNDFVESWGQGLAMAREFLAPREANR